MASKKQFDQRISKRVRQFLNLLKRKKTGVSFVILFGSYARGKAKKDSDIDIAVVSRRFGKNSLNIVQNSFGAENLTKKLVKFYERFL